MPTPARLPEAWAPVSPWTHLARRRWLGWLPRRWRYRRCVTHAPAVTCVCGLYSLRWGGVPAAEGDDDAREEE